MDGSITIGVELEDAGFLAALERLRQTAASGSLAVAQLGARVTGLGSALAAASGGLGSFGQGLRQSVNGALTALTSAGGRFNAAGQTLAARLTAGFAGGNYSAAGSAAGAKLLGSFLAGGYFSGGYQAGAELTSGFQSGGGAVTGVAFGLAASVRGAFSGGWYSVGYAIASGIASGISAGSGAVQAAAVSAARSALAAAKSSLGIASPSRVFRDQVGRMIPAGIAEGVKRGARDTGSVMAKQSGALVRAARNAVIPAARQALGAGGGIRGGGDLRVRLEAPLMVDGRELARATASYMGRQLMWEVTE